MPFANATTYRPKHVCSRMLQIPCARWKRGAPVDLVFQSIGGTEGTNRSFGVTLEMLEEARVAALALGRGTVGDNVMYFETGQGSSSFGQARMKVSISRRARRALMPWLGISSRCW